MWLCFCYHQLVISSDGVNGLCYEHSPSEGIAVIQLMEEFIENSSDLMTTDANTTSPVNPSCGTLQPLQWNVSPALEKHIKDAQYSLDKWVCHILYSRRSDCLVFMHLFIRIVWNKHNIRTIKYFSLELPNQKYNFYQ